MKVMLLWGKMLMTSARICVNEHSNSKLDPHYNMVAKISLKSLQRLGLSAISITNVSTYKITDHSFYSVHWFIESIFWRFSTRTLWTVLFIGWAAQELLDYINLVTRSKGLPYLTIQRIACYTKAAEIIDNEASATWRFFIYSIFLIHRR